MGRWSESGGEIVPAVVVASARVVRITSMSVSVLWVGSFRVCVVIVL